MHPKIADEEAVEIVCSVHLLSLELCDVYDVCLLLHARQHAQKLAGLHRGDLSGKAIGERIRIKT